VPLSLKIEVLGEVQVQRTFLRMSESAHNLTPLWAHLLRRFQAIELLQFSSEGGHGSGGWAELAESTVRTKESKGLRPEIERATDSLMNSLTGSGSGSITEMANEWLRYGTAIPYARFQQTGTVNMPQRRLIQLTETEKRDIARIVQRYVVTGKL